MNAIEKLKAMDARMPGAPWTTDGKDVFTTPDVDEAPADWCQYMCYLRNLAPEMLAVLEAGLTWEPVDPEEEEDQSFNLAEAIRKFRDRAEEVLRG